MALAHECDLASEPGIQYCVACGKADAVSRCSACRFPYCSGKWCVGTLAELALTLSAVRRRALAARHWRAH